MKSIKSLFVLVVILTIGTSVMAQGETAATRSYSGEAINLWNAGEYSEAAEAFKLAAEKINVRNDKARQKKGYYTYMSGLCYELLNKHAAAEQQFEKAILMRYYEYEPIVYFKNGEMEMSQCKHSEAKESFEKYMKFEASETAKRRIESCNYYAEQSKTPTKHLVTNVTKLNTTFYDYGTIMDSRGQEIYFTSSRPGSTGENTDGITGENFMDIWVSKIDRKGNWGQPEPMAEPINSPASEGSIVFDERGKTMWFTRCIVDPDLNIGCDIYTSEAKGKTWSEPTKIVLKDHDTTNVGHPCVSPDGKTLIFASNMAGGYGGLDLWYSTYDRRSDAWSLPVNLGAGINTSENDCFPTWGKNGELYYASNGLVGFGGLDIYRAARIGEENKWENPTNLGLPMNSCRDDYHILYTVQEKEERGFISSNRNGSKGDNSHDIWDFYLPPLLIDLMIIVADQETGDPILDAKVKLVGSDGSSYDLTTDASGQINLGEKPDGTRYLEPGATWTIEIEGIEKMYLGANDNFTTAGVGTNTRIIRNLKMLNIEKPLRLPEVRYALGSAELLVDETINSKDSLNYLYDLLTENPNLVVELISHTDCRGSDAANKKLSQARAESCVRYLVDEKAIDPARLIPRGRGEAIPATLGDVKLTCDYVTSFQKTDKEKFEYYHQLNRRTECVILSFDFVSPNKSAGGAN